MPTLPTGTTSVSQTPSKLPRCGSQVFKCVLILCREVPQTGCVISRTETQCGNPSVDTFRWVSHSTALLRFLIFFACSIVGNKADLCDQRVISYEQGYEYASVVGALFCETSAVTDKGIGFSPALWVDVNFNYLFTGVTQAFGLLAKSLIDYEREHSNFQYKFKADYVNLQEMSDLSSSSENLSTSCCSWKSRPLTKGTLTPALPKYSLRTISWLCATDPTSTTPSYR